MRHLLKHSVLLLGLLVAATPALARETLDNFSANGGKTYETYVGYGDSVYVTYAGVTDTGFKKGGSSNCPWKSSSGSCVSKSEMLSEIRVKVDGKRY